MQQGGAAGRGGIGTGWGVTPKLAALAFATAAAGLTPAHAETLRVTEARDVTVQTTERPDATVQAGQKLSPPWRATLGSNSLLILSGAGCRLELEGLAEAEIGAPAANKARPAPAAIRSFLKPVPQTSAPRAADTVFQLPFGTLLAQVGERPFSLSSPQLQLDARFAVFAVTVSPSEGELVSILRGQVKITTADQSVRFLGAGKCMRVASGLPPKVNLLDESTQGAEHKRGLTRLLLAAQAASNAAGTASNSDVGEGAEAHFDLTRRRRAALLTAPNLPNIGQPDVSPELPQPSFLNP